MTGLRGLEIEDWLKCNDSVVKDYLIIDDDSDMLPYQMGRLIKTDCHNGLLFQNYIDIEKRIKSAFGETYEL